MYSHGEGELSVEQKPKAFLILFNDTQQCR